MPKRTLLATLLLLLVAAAPAKGAPPLLDLRGCLLTVQILEGDLARVRPLVPSAYRPLGWVPGRPFLTLWSARCDAVSVAGGPRRAVNLSVAAFPIDDPDRTGSEELPIELPNLWAHYFHTGWTDDADVAGALREAGFPTRVVAGMRLTRTTRLGLASDAAVAVPSHWSSMTHAFIPHRQEHSHANTFRRGRDVLQLRIPLAVDSFCEGRIGEECGYVAAPAGSVAARFIGGTRRPLVAGVDHDPIPRAVALAYTS